MYQEPHFDKYAFDRRSKAVSSTKTADGWDTTGIAFSDFGSMHIAHRKVQQERRLPTPAWATNDQQLRAVVLRFAEDRLYILDHSGSDEQRMTRIREEEQRRLPDLKKQLEEMQLAYHKNPQSHLVIQIQNKDSEILNLERGVVKLTTAVAYAYYRQGHNSVEIAEEFGLKPPAVRMWCYRMHTVANRLGFQQGQTTRNSPHKYRKLPKHSIHYASKDDALKLFALRAAGASWERCAILLKLRYVESTRIMWQHHFGDLKVAPPRPRKPLKAPRLPKDAGMTPYQVRRAEVLRTLFALRASGKSWDECAAHLKMNDQYVRKFWRQHFGELKTGAPGTPRWGYWTKDNGKKVGELKRLRREGKTFQQIAVALGIVNRYPTQMVRNAFVKYCREG